MVHRVYTQHQRKRCSEDKQRAHIPYIYTRRQNCDTVFIRLLFTVSVIELSASTE